MIRLIVDELGPAVDQAAALDSLLFMRDPLRVTNPMNSLFGSLIPNTGVIVFAENLELAFFEPASTVGLNLVDSNNQSFTVSAEHVAPVSISGLNLTQVGFRLPQGLAPGPCVIKLVVHNKVSNSATLRIAP